MIVHQEETSIIADYASETGLTESVEKLPMILYQQDIDVADLKNHVKKLQNLLMLFNPFLDGLLASESQNEKTL